MLLVRAKLLEREQPRSRDRLAGTHPHRHVHRCPDPLHPGQFSAPPVAFPAHPFTRFTALQHTTTPYNLYSSFRSLLSFPYTLPLCPKPLGGFPFLSVLKSELPEAARGWAHRPPRLGARSAFHGQNECLLLSVPRDPPQMFITTSLLSASPFHFFCRGTLLGLLSAGPHPSAPPHSAHRGIVLKPAYPASSGYCPDGQDPPRLGCNQAAAGGRVQRWLQQGELALQDVLNVMEKCVRF